MPLLAFLLLAAATIFRTRTSESAMATRHAIVERMSHGMMVLDWRHRVVDLNLAAKRLLGAEGQEVIGQDARDLLAAWPELLRIITHDAAAYAEVAVNDGQPEHVFDVHASPLFDSGGQCTGKLVLWIDVTENKAAQAANERQRFALAALAEREQVGRELHDGLVQVLGYIKMQAQASSGALERGRPDTANAGLQGIAAIAQEAHEEIQDFLLGARATSRLSSGLWDAITDFAERYSVVYGLRIDLALPQQAQDIVLDPVAQVQLLRIIQESLTNVRKHAGASRVDLAATCETYCLQVIVRDDGKGFDPHEVPGLDDGHYGLAFMYQRAEAVGARLDIISAPGRGTTVLVQVPVAQQAGEYATTPRG